MSEFLNAIEWGEPVVPPKLLPEVERALTPLTGGVVPQLARYVGHSPWLGPCLLPWFARAHSHADIGAVEWALAVASQENACRYCYGSLRSQLRIVGFSDKQIAQFEQGLLLAEFSAKERAVIAFGRLLARSTPRPAAAAVAKLHDVGYTRPAAAEIAFYVSFACFANRVATMLSVPPEIELERVPETFTGKLLRPVLAAKVRRARPRLRAAPPMRASFPPPFAPVLAALDGTPVLAYVETALKGALTCDFVPKRAKLLMLGVVARGLGCTLCEPAAKSALVANGADPSFVDEVLDTLSSPALTPLEARLVPFARASIRYRTGDVQRAARALTADFGPEVAVDAVGSAALANMLSRVAMLVQ